MNRNAMTPFGKALLAYFNGDRDAELIIHRDDGLETHIPANHFFRVSSQLSPLEKKAIENCKGHILDAGAGSGIHSLVLQQNGFQVTALDITPQAVDIMKKRNIKDVRQGDIFNFHGGPFNTILMLGHGIGMVETLAGLKRFLNHAQNLLSKKGQLLLDSLDVTKTDDPRNHAYLDANRKAGRYVGEIRIQFEFDNETGPYCSWLHIDPKALKNISTKSGWQCRLLCEEKMGDYLAKLSI
jgi:SAM-dependent methyltransferase